MPDVPTEDRRGGGVDYASTAPLVLDDWDFAEGMSSSAPSWRGFSDRVMGGVSRETVALVEIAGRRCLRLTGEVRLDNNGGFIQMVRDLAADGGFFDGSAFDGICMQVHGNGEPYGLHLRTADCVRPWQSYRAGFVAEPRWREIRMPFDRFRPHRLTAPFDLHRLRRLGLVAIGRAFAADLAISRLALYRGDG